MTNFLVVGYGNILRGDDGLGPRVAESFKGTACPAHVRVRVLCLPQLDLSLVAVLQDADVAVFVDARHDVDEDLLQVDRIAPENLPAPSDCAAHSTHAVRISALLAITSKWYGKVPSCYLVKPKGFDFSIGANLSAKGNQAAELARQAIRDLLWRTRGFASFQDSAGFDKP